MLYALLAAAFAAGWAAASWRYLTMRRALTRERAAARLCAGAAARDIAALEQLLEEATADLALVRAAGWDDADLAVVRAAESVVGAAARRYQQFTTDRQHPKGGSDAA